MSLTDQIAGYLKDALSVDPNARMSAELKISEASSNPETGLALGRLIALQDADIYLRQSATIVLRKYVKERWSPYWQTSKGSAPSPEIKSEIRQAVFNGLSDPNRKIRSSCAHTLSSIANCDWPDEYPELLSSLISLLSSGSPNSVHGAMQVFTEFIKSDLTEDQILPVLRNLLPVLLNILGSTDHTPLTRARTISVFRQCVTALFMVKEQHPQSVKEAIASVLPVWLEAFKVLLSIDPTQDLKADSWDGLAIRIQTFRTLDTIHTSFPRALTPYLKEFLSLSLLHLNSLYPAFQEYYVNASIPAPSSSEDDETIELPQLLCPVIDFVSAVVRGGKARDWFEKDKLNSLMSVVFNVAQITDEDEETWGSNANAFVAQEDDETSPYGVRVASFDLLASLVDRSPALVSATFQQTIQHVINVSKPAREAGAENWWKPLEASLAAIGSQAEAVLDCVEDEQDAGRPKPIDIESLLTEVVPSILNLPQHPFLQGRGFIFASQYARALPAQLAGQYLEAAMQVLESSDASIPVKISAVKAISNFCQGGEEAVLLPFVARIAHILGPFLLSTTEDTLSLVVEALSVVVEVGDSKWMTPELAGSLTGAILEVWKQNNKDPIILSVLSDILETLASSEASGVYAAVVQSALPSLAHAIGAAKTEESWIVSAAIELVTSLASGAKEGALGDGFFAMLAPNLFTCLQVAEDRDVLQNGVICLTLVVRKDCNQLLTWKDSEGQSGLDNVFKIIAKLLNSQDESGGLAIGDLIIHLLRRAGESVLPVLPQLLQAMLSRMLTAKTATFLQSLIIPFTYLINNQRDTVLSMLESTDVNGRSGLDVFIQTWCENAETFQGFWPSRISTMAFTQLYTAERPSLQNLTVKGDMIVNPETRNTIMTRSRTRAMPTQFTSIPFPVKALKILIHEVQSGGDSAMITAQDQQFGEVESDDGDDEWADDAEQGLPKDEFGFLSDMLGPKGLAFDNDDILETNDDEDLKNDPISQMDMQGHLVAFFKECAARNTGNFSAVVEKLTPEETMVVRQILA